MTPSLSGEEILRGRTDLQAQYGSQAVVHLREKIAEFVIVDRILSRLVHVAIAVINDAFLISVASMLG